MFRIYCLCVLYCFTMSVAMGCFAFNTTRFSGYAAGTTCLTYPNKTNQFEAAIKFGFAVHFIGIFCDAGMAVQVKNQANKLLAKAAPAAVGIYTLTWLVWLIYTIAVRYNATGKECSLEGAALTKQHYLTQQGQVLQNFVIGTLCANVGIVVYAVVDSILTNKKKQNI